MPRYFFDILDDINVVDDCGLMLPGLEEARREAVRALIGVAGDILPDDGPAKRITVKVRDEIGNVVITTQVDFTVRYGG